MANYNATVIANKHEGGSLVEVDAILTVDEAAALKGVHPETLRRALRRGEFRRARAISSGKRKVWILDAEEVEAWQPRPAGWPEKEGTMNTQVLTVRAQLPANAHLSMPDNTPAETISRHRHTRRGALNALKSRRNAAADYARSRGNAAAFRVWIEDGAGREVDPLDLEIEFGPF